MKRTYQPKKDKNKKEHGFMKKNENKIWKKCIKS